MGDLLKRRVDKREAFKTGADEGEGLIREAL